jgi:hypothetical protein
MRAWIARCARVAATGVDEGTSGISAAVLRAQALIAALVSSPTVRYPRFVIRPDVLYHGSGVLVPMLEPRNGSVCAAHDRWVGLPYALVFRPDERGRCQWSLRTGAETRISLVHGSLDTTGVGYLYCLPGDRFEQVNAAVWVCREPVTPLAYEVIRSADYVGWIAKG